jgi:SAM-dependent methyltransferase
MSPEANSADPRPAGAGETPDGQAGLSKHALSFAGVADSYDKARPSYPPEAAAWLVGSTAPLHVLELGAGTGKLTELLVAAGHDVLATDPLPEMLARLVERVPGVRTAVAGAERIPVPTQSVDVVVVAQAFHWFNHPVALDEIARVLRPDGYLALVWNTRDEGIPWVRKLGAIIGGGENGTDLVDPLHESPLFGEVDEAEFRFWQNLRKDDLFDLVRSRSYVAVLPEHERAGVLDRVGALYDDYGRGHDGMKLPYLTRCYRARVLDLPPPRYVEEPVQDEPVELIDGDGTEATGPVPQAPSVRREDPPEDTGTLLIDFR